jgi:hypothetical protein
MGKLTRRSALAATALIVALTRTADAGFIDYTYTTTLTLASGTDSAGLGGAKIVIDAKFDTNAVYIDSLGYPAVLANSGATSTISGSSIAANNGTFALPQLAFFATFAGLFLYPDGIPPTLTLPVGGTLDPNLNTISTPHGGAVVVGDTVNILDFAPARSAGQFWDGSDGVVYAQVNPTVSASLVNAVVPEPSSFALCVIAGVIGLAGARGLRDRMATA